MSCTLPSGRTPTANVMGRCLPISSTTTTNPATASARVSVLIRYDSSQRLGGRPSRSRIRCCRAGVATTVRGVIAASGNNWREASSAVRKTPS